jgi:hypothetical protein
LAADIADTGHDAAVNIDTHGSSDASSDDVVGACACSAAQSQSTHLLLGVAMLVGCRWRRRCCQNTCVNAVKA